MQIFQQDNDPKHSSKLVKSWLKNSGISVIAWPSQSPDLNPIENLWHYVETQLGGRKSKDEAALFEALAKAWSTIDKKYLEKLVESMHDRCKAVIESKGYSTKY